MKITFNAKLVSILLVLNCVLLISLTTTGFIFGLRYLDGIATTTDHAKIDAELASDELETISRLSSFLDNNPELVQKTGSVIASAQQYQYQDEVLRDIQKFAGESGVRIQSFVFEAENATAATPAPAAQTPTAPPATIPGLNLNPTLPAGVKTANATITLARPLTYTNVLRFIKRIDRNPTQLNIQPLTLQVDPVNRSQLQTVTIELKVFTK